VVSLIKHAHHDFDVDVPGKDSWRHRQAGAQEVLVTSERRWALMHELRGSPEPGLEQQLARLSACDLVLVEGFKRAPFAKIEVRRHAHPAPPMAPDDPWIIAIAADHALEDAGLPVLDLNEPRAVAQFIVGWLGQAPMRAPEDGC
jgi:molybdopterin-guanine dinucleotide biosynthesis protein B